MTKTFRFPALAVILGTSLSATLSKAVDFERDIEPMLKEHCFKCHSGPRAKKKIRYDNVRYFKEVVGNHEHAIVIPGNPEASKMYKLASLPQTSTDAMPPPRRGKPLNSAQKALLRKWIEEGASFESQPEEAPSEAPTDAPATEAMADPYKIHTWTNAAGKTLQAAFISVDATSVKLRKEDGTEFSYPLAQLSAESQKLAADLAK